MGKLASLNGLKLADVRQFPTVRRSVVPRILRAVVAKFRPAGVVLTFPGKGK